jgi:hypothetical protein
LALQQNLILHVSLERLILHIPIEWTMLEQSENDFIRREP